jgi:hypothetical protein
VLRRGGIDGKGVRIGGGILNRTERSPYDRLVRIGIGILVAAVVGSPSIVLAGSNSPDGAAIVRGAGRVKVDGTHEWRDTSTADILTTGITVEAATEQPLEMTLPDGVTVTLEPRALARWMPGGKLPSEINHWTHGYHLLLEEGELEVRMPLGQKGAHAFLVSTKAGTLTDWRGQLHVSVHRDATSAAIYEGALVVGSNGQGFPVYDGAGILMRRGVNPDKTRGIPASPQWSAASGGFAVMASDVEAPVDLAWGPVANAAEYRVEVALDPSMVRVTERAVTREPHFTTTPRGASGPRWVHVRAVGTEGIVGAWSAPRALRVIRYKMPPDAFVARDGVIVLARGERLALQDAEGIEVASESVGDLAPRFAVPLYWGRLGGPLPLAEDAPLRIVHLRDPVLGAEAQLVLARRELRADVALAPTNARWPADPIDARVEVRDPSGRIDVSSENVTVETTLDLTPLGVHWQRVGNTWRGRIDPRLIGDPSVVRVVVRDSRGSEIGRGFVELEPVALK